MPTSVPMATLSWPRNVDFTNMVSFALVANNPATDPVTFHDGDIATFPDGSGGADLASLTGAAGDVAIVVATVRLDSDPTGVVDPAGSYKPSGFTHIGSRTTYINPGTDRWHMTSVWGKLLTGSPGTVTVPSPTGRHLGSDQRSKAAAITLSGLPGFTLASNVTTNSFTGGTSGAATTPTLPDVTAHHYTGISVSGVRNNLPTGATATGTGWSTYNNSAGDNSTSIAYLLEGVGPVVSSFYSGVPIGSDAGFASV